MKKVLTVIWALGMSVVGLAQSPQGTPTPKTLQATAVKPMQGYAADAPQGTAGKTLAGIDRWSVRHQTDAKLFEKTNPKEAARLKAQHQARKPQRLPEHWEGTDTTAYFAVAQSYMKNYAFTYEGGDVLTYQVGVFRDGNRVVFSNLFNLFDPTSWSLSSDFPVTGTYDEATKTITIPTKSNFADATVCASIMGGYYVGALMAGTVNEEGKMTPQDELVLNVEGDFERIYTQQAFGVSEFTQDGSQNYGFFKTYRRFSINLPKAGASLMKFNDIVNFGETFPATPVSKGIDIVNTGSDATDYVITVVSDGDAMTATTMSGTLPAQSNTPIDFSFTATEPGDYEGLATLEYEGGEPMLIQLGGSVKAYPDYQQVVTQGDFAFTTNLEFPFELTTLTDGTKVARSSTNGKYGSSKLTMTFTVPEGKMGKLSWKGESNNKNGYSGGAGGVFVDDLNYCKYVYSGQNDDISRTEELAPGEHTVRFQYDQYYYTGDPEEGLYVYDLNLQTEDLAADAAILKTTSLNMGNYIKEEGKNATGEAYVTLQNRGANVLKVNKVTSDNSEFSGNAIPDEVACLDTINVPVIINASAIGAKQANITIETTGGTFTVPVTANVIAMPDYASIVTEGLEYMTFEANAAHPFIVENGKAYNMNSKQVDNEPSTSSFKVSFTIPEGKLGYISWDGHCWGTPETVENYWYYDQGMIGFQHPMAGGTKNIWGGDMDGSSAGTFGSDEVWADYLACVPGDHWFEFKYYQGGDGVYYGEDRFEISNLKLHVIDFKENNVELLTPEVTFEPTYVGPQRYTTATVKLKNTGSATLFINEIPGAAPFYGIVPENDMVGTAFNKTTDVTLWFFPEEEGTFTGDLTIKTTGGDVTVKCNGQTKDQTGIIYPGDIEDAAYGWIVFDANMDGETWNLGANLWGDNPNYVHTGHDCLASISYSNGLGSITPDNWTASPAITIPEDGGKLTYYVAPFSPDRYAEHYSLYITENASTTEAIAAGGAVLEETIDAPCTQDESGYVDGWMYREVDLSAYAGKTIYVAFRHHGCTGQYILRLDDIFVYNADGSGIKGITGGDAAKGIIRQEIFNAQGKRLAGIMPGLNIIRTVYADGSERVAKVMRK